MFFLILKFRISQILQTDFRVVVVRPYEAASAEFDDQVQQALMHDTLAE